MNRHERRERAAVEKIVRQKAQEIFINNNLFIEDNLACGIPWSMMNNVLNDARKLRVMKYGLPIRKCYYGGTKIMLCNESKENT